MSVKAVVSEEVNRGKGYKRQTTFLCLLAILIYMLPVRFGASWLSGNLPSYPNSFLFAALPTSFLHLFTCILFTYGVIAFKPTGLSRRSTLICGLWALITLSCAVFGYFEANLEFYINSVNQMLTVTLVTVTAAIAIENNPRAKSYILAGLCGGLLHTVLNGAYQYLWGFADTQAFYREQMAQGVYFPPGQVNRIMQKYVYSTFTISNSFAGHLILTIPILLFGWKKYFTKDNPDAVKAVSFMLVFFGCSNAFSSSNVSLGIIATFIGLIFLLKGNELPQKVYDLTGLFLFITSLVILGLTKSRAGIVCFGGGFLFATYLTAEKKIHKNLALVTAVVGFLAALVIAPKVGSFQVRLGYYRSMLDTFMKDMWGYGFGSFASAYNGFKDAGIEESNVPHSFFFGYLGQGGVVAALAVIVCFVGTVYLIKSSSLDRFAKFCFIFGFSSWYFHAQLDFHIMIIGSLSCVGLVSLLCVTEEDKASLKLKYVFVGLIPFFLLTGYLNFKKILSDRCYFELYETLRDVRQTPTLDEVKKLVAKVDARENYSVRHLRESGNWAINQFLVNKSINPIQKFEYLKFAEESLLRSNEKYPLETGIYVSLARVYKFQDNYEKARQMLDKAFEVYPFSPSAISLELVILQEYRLRYPKESHFHEAFLKNKLKTVESHLGRLRFSEHLNLSSEQLNSIMISLEKAANEIFAEIAIISGFGIQLDTSGISVRVNEILKEARILLK